MWSVCVCVCVAVCHYKTVERLKCHAFIFSLLPRKWEFRSHQKRATKTFCKGIRRGSLKFNSLVMEARFPSSCAQDIPRICLLPLARAHALYIKWIPRLGNLWPAGHIQPGKMLSSSLPASYSCPLQLTFLLTTPPPAVSPLLMPQIPLPRADPQGKSFPSRNISSAHEVNGGYLFFKKKSVWKGRNSL